ENGHRVRFLRRLLLRCHVLSLVQAVLRSPHDLLLAAPEAVRVRGVDVERLMDGLPVVDDGLTATARAAHAEFALWRPVERHDGFLAARPRAFTQRAETPARHHEVSGLVTDVR